MLSFEEFIAKHTELQDLDTELQQIAYAMYCDMADHIWVED